MPSYSIRRESFGPGTKPRFSLAATSVYSEDDEPAYPPDDMAEVPPLRVRKVSQAEYHAHPQQQISDDGQKIRTSRLPIFNQVRSMLHKPPTVRPAKWDEYTGEFSESGKAAQVKPSTYKNPYEGAFQARRSSPERRKGSKRTESLSPVSILRYEEMGNSVVITGGPQRRDRSVSPVSPVSALTPHEKGASDLPINQRAVSEPVAPLLETPVPPGKAVKRKPAPKSVNLAREPVTPEYRHSRGNDAVPPAFDSPPTVLDSRFSWTTAAPSEAPRHSVDDARIGIHETPPRGRNLPSRFSWTTVGTSNTPLRGGDPAPPSPPPISSKFSTPPVQSIVSRGRPVARLDKEPRPPPANPSSTAASSSGASSTTELPKLITSTRTVSPQPMSAPGTGGKGPDKKLPLPPELVAATSSMSRIEALLRQEQDIVHQRRNIEHLIAENLRAEQTSPIDMPFAAYKDAQKRLAQHRARLAEVQLEEREIGIAISRARRKEGEEEGLWIRRVTA